MRTSAKTIEEVVSILKREGIPVASKQLVHKTPKGEAWDLIFDYNREARHPIEKAFSLASNFIDKEFNNTKWRQLDVEKIMEDDTIPGIRVFVLDPAHPNVIIEE